MAHLNEQMLVRIADLMGASHTASFAAVCRACGIAESTLYNWRAQCERDRKADDKSSPFYISFRGQKMWFTEAAQLARAEHLATAEAELRSQAVSGIIEPVRNGNGELIWKLNPRYVGRTDEYVMLDADCEPSEVAWHRLAHDANGNPIGETKVTQVPAQLKLAVLAAAHSDYQTKSHQTIDVHHSGGIVHEQRPPLRKPGEMPSASIAELRALAALSPEERRQRMGVSPYPTDANGRRTLPRLAPPMNEPQPPQPDEGKPRPSYAKPSQKLDQASYGPGSPPPGGFEVA